MIIIALTVTVLLSIRPCSTDLWFFNKIKRMVGSQANDKTIKGTFKRYLYLGSIAKISCFGDKHPTQSFRRLSWFQSGKRLSNSDHYKINKHGILTINGVSIEDTGEFICLIISKSGRRRLKHDVTVIQFPSKSLHLHFIYAVRLCSSESENFATHFIESKVKEKVCLENECKLGFIHSSCYFEKFANPKIKVTVPVLLPGVPNDSCNMQCTREKQDFLKEKVKQNVISAVMQGKRLKIREEPSEMSVSYLETEEDKICDPGFEMKGSIGKSLCFPCTPGHFLEKGYCIPCHLNHYNGKHAATKCRACFGNRVTRSRGAVSEDDCYYSRVHRMFYEKGVVKTHEDLPKLFQRIYGVADPDVLWIMFMIFLIVVSLILLCCCWSIFKYLCSCNFFKRKNEFNSNKKVSKSVSGSSGNSSHRKPLIGLKQPLDETLPKRKISAPESSFVIPSVRLSAGRDLFYKPLRPVTKGILPPPPPPPPPSDSALKERTRNMTYHTVGRLDKPETRNPEQVERIAAGRHITNKISDTPLKERNDILPQYRERIKKSKPMYAAYTKERI